MWEIDHFSLYSIMEYDAMRTTYVFVGGFLFFGFLSQKIIIYLLYNFEAIHNKDYSVVKTFKVAG
jgi:hypothetical protein